MMPLSDITCESRATTPNKFLILIYILADFIAARICKDYWKIYLKELHEGIEEDVA